RRARRFICTARCGTAVAAKHSSRRRGAGAATDGPAGHPPSDSGSPGRWRWGAGSRDFSPPGGTPTSGVRWARSPPPGIVAGWDNRTCGFRLCGEGAAFRVENRIPGADANAYLAFAATIAAGLHGIASKLKAPKPYDGNAYQDATLPQVPKTMREAIGELERSRVARAAFGDRGIEHYLH